MRVEIDSEKCQGHGRCYALAPEVFDCDDEGYPVLKGSGEVSGDAADVAQLAVDNCPEYAIAVIN